MVLSELVEPLLSSADAISNCGAGSVESMPSRCNTSRRVRAIVGLPCWGEDTRRPRELQDGGQVGFYSKSARMAAVGISLRARCKAPSPRDDELAHASVKVKW
jgi:hypothetical protein